jgi:hypothetical protein
MRRFSWKAGLPALLLQAALSFAAMDGTAGGGSGEASEVPSPSSSSDTSNDLSFSDFSFKDVSNDGPDDSLQVTVPAGTLLRVEVSRRGRLRQGGEVQARLLEPIYAENRLVVASGALLQGTIVETRPASRSKRLNAKLRGDFTPLREPVIQWTLLSRADGTEYALAAESTTSAGGTLYFRTAPPQRVSFSRRVWETMAGRKNKQVHTDEVPHKGERLQKYLWSQIPLHPQYLEQGMRYEMKLTDDLQVAARALPAAMTDVSQPRPLQEAVWVYSRLQTGLDSATAQPGDPVEAVVTAPVHDEQNRLVLPQNSVLHGKVLSAEPSRRWGHNGTLRFVFHQVSWPAGFTQKVEAAPVAVGSSPAAKMAIDQEGGVARQNEHSLAAPLLMGLLAGSTLGDEDAGRGKITASSNGFALIGRVVGLVSGSPYVGGSIGAVATARSIYRHWLAHGKETSFAPQTQIILEVAPAHSNPISAEK